MQEERTESFERHIAEALEEVDALGKRLASAEFAADMTEAEQAADARAAEALEAEHWALFRDLCELDEEFADGEWVVEAILGRRLKKATKAGELDKLYYKVKWRGHNFVSWELNESILQRKLVEEFEAIRKTKYLRPSNKLRPVVYVSARKRKAGHLPANKAGTGAWACEVEPYIWIPYDEEVQKTLERAFTTGQKEAAITIGLVAYTVDFATMQQRRAGGSARKVHRQQVLPEAEERARMEAMSLQELRDHIATIVEFTPLHYEMLARLHDLDKVAVNASSSELASLHRCRFEEVLDKICEGAEFPGFSQDCAICLEDYVPQSSLCILPNCGHVFHAQCVTDYFKKYSKYCPVCKASL